MTSSSSMSALPRRWVSSSMASSSSRSTSRMRLVACGDTGLGAWICDTESGRPLGMSTARLAYLDERCFSEECLLLLCDLSLDDLSLEDEVLEEEVLSLLE